ncbi:MAG: endonuclease [bacterium]|nr:endonuclease [bacterium]
MKTRKPNPPIYQTLLKHYGAQHWWPGKSKFEIVVGCILTQNTNWRNVERSIANLLMQGIDTEEKYLELSEAAIKELIRPSGYQTAKGQTLQRLCNWLLSHSSFDGVQSIPTQQLRNELLSIKGIGPETADAILLYAMERPVTVSDAYTKRIAVRLGALPTLATYDDCVTWLTTLAPLTVPEQNELHALIVAHGKLTCHKRNPACDKCPLQNHCARIGG